MYRDYVYMFSLCTEVTITCTWPSGGCKTHRLGRSDGGGQGTCLPGLGPPPVPHSISVLMDPLVQWSPTVSLKHQACEMLQKRGIPCHIGLGNKEHFISCLENHIVFKCSKLLFNLVKFKISCNDLFDNSPHPQPRFYFL